tara:strand:- start:310 stop:753 length:444 start_codon:yes stop_codon:yes gene_type:complete
MTSISLISFPSFHGKKIEMIDVFSVRFATEEGIKVGSTISDAARTFGGLKEIMMSEIESREYAEFSDQPSGLYFQVYGDNSIAGNYPAGNNPTAQANPGAWISSIEVTGRQIMGNGGIGGITLDTTEAGLLKTAGAMNFGEIFKGKD